MRASTRLVAAALGGAALACGGPSDPVEALLASVSEAVAERDADALREHLAPGFRGEGGMNRDAAWQTVRRFLLGYESASVSFYDVVQQPRAGGVQVSLVAEFSGRPRALGGLSGLLPPDAVYAFDLDLEEGPEGLLLVGASWERRDVPGTGGEGVSSPPGGEP